MGVLYGVGLLFFVALIAPGYSLECYTCTNVKVREGLTSVVDEVYAVEQCAEDVSGLSKVNCTNEGDVCGYVSAKVSGNPQNVLLGKERTYATFRGCLKITGLSDGCYDGIDYDLDIKAMLENLTGSTTFTEEKTCVCDESSCDAQICGGVELAGRCLEYWILGVIVGVVVILIIVIVVCCYCCARRKKEEHDQPILVGDGKGMPGQPATPGPQQPGMQQPM